jgi:hypothetical protein
VRISGRVKSGALFFDQAISGLSNYIFLFLSARLLTPNELGHLILVYGIYASCMAILRSSLGQTLLFHGGNRGSIVGSLGMGSVIGLICAIIVLGMGLATDQLATAGAIAVTAPLLMLADVRRYQKIQAGDLTPLILYDSAWLLLELVAFSLVYQYNPSPATLLFLYGVTGVIPAALMIHHNPKWLRLGTWHLSGAREEIRRGVGWLRHNGKSLGTFTYETGWQSIWANATTALLATIAGFEILGGYQAAQTPILPLSTVTAAYAILLSTSLGPDVEMRQKRRWRAAIFLGIAALSILATINPGDVLKLAFGPTVADIPLAVGLVGLGAGVSLVSLEASLRLRRMRDLRYIVLSRSIAAPAETVMVVAGAMILGTTGTAVAFLAVRLMNGAIPILRLRVLRARKIGEQGVPRAVNNHAVTMNIGARRESA